MTNQQFIRQQTDRLKTQVETIDKRFYNLSFEALNYKSSPEKWSVLECIEHLNRYSRFYLPHLRRTFIAAKHSIEFYTRGWLGEKLVKMIEPSNPKKQKTLSHMNPVNSHLTKAVLDEFSDHQQELLILLKKSDDIDLNKKTIPIEFFRLLKMKRGVALEFIISHQERHIQQALRSALPFSSLVPENA